MAESGIDLGFDALIEHIEDDSMDTNFYRIQSKPILKRYSTVRFATLVLMTH